MAIREHADASEEERKVTLCNAGVMAFDGRRALEMLDRIGNANSKGEYYLTDAVDIVREMGLEAVVIETSEDEVRGINTKAQLAEAEAVMQARLRKAALDAGVTLIAPETVFLAADTKFGRDVTIEPFVVIGPGVTIADGAVIHAFSHIVQASIGKKALGRPLCAAAARAPRSATARKIGNFVETKAATLEAGAKVNHLSYIGDAHVGANANIGAGTITCNYDGFDKHQTDDRRGRLHRLQLLAGGAGEDRQGRLYRLGLGHHQGRAGRRDGGGAQPADQPRGLGEALSRDEDAGKKPKEG